MTHNATLRSMRTLLPDPPPAELQPLLERRRRSGADRFDEVWEGVGAAELRARIDWPPIDDR
jgi:hypothetical protein